MLKALSLLGATLVACGLLAGCEAGESPPDSLAALRGNLPREEGLNVIAVSFDALRADALGIYGYGLKTSPNIDRFADRCLVFDNAYTVAPVTPTSFAATWTGLLPTRVFHAWNLAYDDTIARRFSQAGYSTAAFINNAQLTPERRFQTGFELYDFYRSVPDEQILESALIWFSEHRRKKIFAWVHFLTPHAPYEYRPASAAFYDPDYQGPFEKTTGGEFEVTTATDLARVRSLYDGEVFYADSLFERLRAGLEEMGLLENSILLLTSDHGEEFQEHGRLQHDRLYEEHVRVPLLLYHPRVRSHHRSPVLVSNVDLLPTLLSLVGAEYPAAIDGRDLTSLTDGSQLLVAVAMTGKEWWLSIRDADYKLLRSCKPDEESRELYHLAADPGETTNLLADSDRLTEHRRVLSSLDSNLGTILGGNPCEVTRDAVQGKSPTVGLDRETIEALKALGYLGGD